MINILSSFKGRIGNPLLLALGLALGFGFWTATAPLAIGQDDTDGSYLAQVRERLAHPQKSLRDATNTDYLNAVCKAVQDNRDGALGIVRAAAAFSGLERASKPTRKQIVDRAFGCLDNDCDWFREAYSRWIKAHPDHASGMSVLFAEIIERCGAGTGAPDEGYYGGVTQFNINPPPGTVGGGGSLGGLVLICRDGVEELVTPQRAQELVDDGEATFGNCVVTQEVNR